MLEVDQGGEYISQQIDGWRARATWKPYLQPILGYPWNGNPVSAEARLVANETPRTDLPAGIRRMARPWARCTRLSQSLGLNPHEPYENLLLLALDLPDHFITKVGSAGSIHWHCPCPLHWRYLLLTPSVLDPRLAPKRSPDSN